MRQIILSLAGLLVTSSVAFAEVPAAPTPPAGAPPQAALPKGPGKENANPCRDEVAGALQKLRKASWFRMTTNMITENGPTAMEVDYVLPDKMHQKVTQTLTKQTTEIVLVGDKAWGDQGKGWQVLSSDLTLQLKAQLYENVIEQQTDVGNYSCKGKTQIDGKDAMAYKLEEEPSKDSTAPKNEAFRMFYVDATTGMPLSNALLAPGRENAPMFKASYSYPMDLKIEAPKDVAPEAAPAATPAPAPAAATEPGKSEPGK